MRRLAAAGARGLILVVAVPCIILAGVAVLAAAAASMGLIFLFDDR